MGKDETARVLDLPHDAMLEEPRAEENPGGFNISHFAGGNYLYRKRFRLSGNRENSSYLLEFEGVYRNARVILNGKEVCSRPYGYTKFAADIGSQLDFEAENLLEVEVYNAEQPNSRWYSGSGIYRPVWLHILPKKHVELYGLRIRTLATNAPRIEVEVRGNAVGPLSIEILDGQQTIARAQAELQEFDQGFQAKTEVDVPSAKLWSEDAPNLYQCRVRFFDDERIETFGIRSIHWSAEQGFQVNGQRTILRGACIHHDNGILGACSYADAEERKVRLLKDAGYNAIRSAHNPCSASLLEACDRLGMYVMDEYVDMWYIKKTEYDYSAHVDEWWQQDLTDMVEKDFNHPSVIMYSTGNEVSETSQKRGIQFTGEMTDFLHAIDPTRPVTCGINIFFNYLSSIGLGVHSDKKAKKEAQKAERTAAEANKGNKKGKAVGSEFYNRLAGLLGDKTMKLGATLHGCDVRTRDAFANMDIAGYNYGILRYPGDLKKYPKRLILGTETFCKDAYSFYEQAKANPRIIGDFVWAGIDYLGETGIGAWEYRDYAPVDKGPGWISAGSGRLDITGKALGEAGYTRVAFEQETAPVIAVRPVYQSGAHSPSAWKMTDAIESWSWRGCAGMKADVSVYARAHQVELLLNGKSVGKKRVKKNCLTRFPVVYQDGELTAVARDADGREIGRSSLQTAGQETELRALSEVDIPRSGGLWYVRLAFTDKQGTVKPMERGEISISSQGADLIGLGNGCPYNEQGYLHSSTDSYYGEALAIFKVHRNAQKVSMSASCRDLSANLTLQVEPAEDAMQSDVISEQVI